MRSVFQTFLSAVESYLIIFTPPPKHHTLATCHNRHKPFSLRRALAESRRLLAPAARLERRRRPAPASCAIVPDSGVSRPVVMLKDFPLSPIILVNLCRELTNKAVSTIALIFCISGGTPFGFCSLSKNYSSSIFGSMRTGLFA